MDIKILIDSIMRQTTVLLGQLSVSAGVRAPLSHLADEVFLSLSQELESQGLSRKVVADMFGMALRGYQRRVQRLRESATDKGQTLWQSVLDELQREGHMTRRALLERFEQDDPNAIGAVLNDLLNSGLAYRSGGGSNVLYGSTPDEERRTLAREGQLETASTLLWLELCRAPGVQPEEARARLVFDSPTFDAALKHLLSEGQVQQRADGGLEAEAMVIPVGTETAWAAALFDHYRAVCTAMTTKLRQGSTRSDEGDKTGGATWTFEVAAEHPLLEQAEALLKKTREQVQKLWLEVEAENQRSPVADDDVRRVTFYCGQYVQNAEKEG